MSNFWKYLSLIGVNLLYASIIIASKFTSQQNFPSNLFLLGIVITVFSLGVYAIIWQQILKRIDLTTAYMFKGTSIIFVLLLSSLLFNETITIKNIIGTVIIITGVALFAKADNDKPIQENSSPQR